MSILTQPRIIRELVWPQSIAQGARGAEVRRLQEWLSLRGFATSLDGDFGPATGRALANFAQASRIPFGGIATPPLLEALSAPLRRAFAFTSSAPTLRQTLMEVAQQHASQHPREVGGDNRGPWVRAYCGADGAPFAWCAGAVSTLLAQAAFLRDLPVPIPFTLGCDELAASATRAHRLTHDPRSVRAGDIFLVRHARNPADWIHTGIVTAMHADHMETIEGNTNDTGSRNGYELIPRTRGLAGKDYILLAA